MMATTTGFGEAGGVSIGAVIGRAFGVMGDNPVTIFGLAFLLGAVPQMLMSIVGATTRGAALAAADGTLQASSFIAVTTGGGLVYIVLAMLLQGALVRATAAFADGGQAGLGECLAIGTRAALPLLGLAILFAIGVGFGFLLLFVPGVMLYIRWAVAAPALVEERCGIFAAFSRSAALTKGARWRIFGLMLVLLVVLWLVSGVAGVAMLTAFTPEGLAGAGLSPVALAVNAILGTFLSALMATVPASLYVELRRWKDGPGNAQLADVFA